MLTDSLKEIQQDLKHYTNHSKSLLMEKYISERLNKCLQTYYEELNESSSYLQARNPFQLAKRLNRSL